MEQCTAKKYLAILETLYSVSEEGKQSILSNSDYVEEQLFGYAETDIKFVVEDYFLHKDGKLPPKLGAVLLMLRDKGVPYYGGFRNSNPISKKDYEPTLNKTQIINILNSHWDNWRTDNPHWYTKYKKTYELSKKTFFDKDTENKMLENVKKMARELALDVWRYKDSTGVKNSILDPKFWLSHKSVILTCNDGLLMAIGVELINLAQNANKG